MTRTTSKAVKGLAVLGLAVLGLLFSGPSQAQTAIGCSTAADVLKASERGVEDLRLRYSYADIIAVNEIVLRSVGLAYVGFADTVQVFCQRRSKSTPLAGVKMHHLMRFSPAGGCHGSP